MIKYKYTVEIKCDNKEKRRKVILEKDINTVKIKKMEL